LNYTCPKSANTSAVGSAAVFADWGLPEPKKGFTFTGGCSINRLFLGALRKPSPGSGKEETKSMREKAGVSK
jgi:hypothetical protein